MKKIIITASVVSSLIGLTAAHAGTMGPVAAQLPSMVPFAVLEASYTWNQLSTSTINSQTATPTTQGWGGRFGAGFAHPLSESLSLTTELGGGYYGSNKFSLASQGISTRSTIDGYDFLVGGTYTMNQFDLFGKVGVMVQNLRSSVTQDYSKSLPGGLYSGTVVTHSNTTQALPEVKVGGIYNWTESWGLTVAYMHVFGNSPAANIGVNATAGAISANGNTNNQNPSLDSIMFGLNYKFV